MCRSQRCFLHRHHFPALVRSSSPLPLASCPTNSYLHIFSTHSNPGFDTNSNGLCVQPGPVSAAPSNLTIDASIPVVTWFDLFSLSLLARADFVCPPASADFNAPSSCIQSCSGSLLLTPSNTCAATCPDGTYTASGVCRKCSITFSNSVTCTSAKALLWSVH